MSIISEGDIRIAVRVPVKELEVALTKKINEISFKLDGLKPVVKSIREGKVENGELKLCHRNNMVFWTKIPDACTYRLRLFLENMEIDDVELERSKCHYTFDGLIGDGYLVKLDVEDRNGKVINTLDIRL